MEWKDLGFSFPWRCSCSSAFRQDQDYCLGMTDQWSFTGFKVGSTIQGRFRTWLGDYIYPIWPWGVFRIQLEEQVVVNSEKSDLNPASLLLMSWCVHVTPCSCVLARLHFRRWEVVLKPLLNVIQVSALTPQGASKERMRNKCVALTHILPRRGKLLLIHGADRKFTIQKDPRLMIRISSNSGF